MDQDSYDESLKTKAYVGELNAQALAEENKRLIAQIEALIQRVSKLEGVTVQLQQEMQQQRMMALSRKTIGSTA